MNKLLTLTTVIGVLTTLSYAEAAMKKQVNFESQNQTIIGDLYLPDNYQDGQKLPGVVVTGAWTTVKEQMPTTYAIELANKGYAALVFDFRGWGNLRALLNTWKIQSVKPKIFMLL